VNYSLVDVFDRTSQTFQPKQWKDCEVGEIVKVKEKHFLPADIVMLSTSENLGVCYIETSSLDG
jgi:magnesium-transporting ATPase (P-type)